jgi:putative peptide zinc metalloprotease protein
VGPAVVLAAVHWPELARDVTDRLLAPQNLALLWLSFPVIKMIHEFGHAFVTKVFGGEVHDMGVMVLVLTPVPYVEASSAWAFRSKWQRIAVGAAGMLVELFLAALALFVWLNAEPGTVRALAYNTMLIAGVSTVLFNANPLLRYDGYYILSDLLEIPNLRPRATAYFGYLCERHLFGRRDAEAPAATPGERAWFIAYFVASATYRVLVVVGILLFLADRFFLLGIVLAAAAAIGWVLVPMAKGLSYLFTSPRIRSVRARAIAVSAALILALGGLIGFVPVPFRSQAEGVVWIPDESFVRAGTEGFIERVVARPGARVRSGDLLLELSDPTLSARVEGLAARLRELEARYTEQQPKDLVKAEIVKEELLYVAQTLARARERAAELTIRSRTTGTFVVPVADDLPGRFVRQGDLLGYVVELGQITVRTVVAQSDIDLVRYRTRQVHVRLAERIADSKPAGIVRIVPGATERLPTTALGSEGGGRIAIDPRDTQGVTAIQKLFQIDLELPAHARVLDVGGRAYVRFDHGWAPLAVQFYLEVRQIFLARFNV